ncbi:MAG: hypothetical protein GVY15_00300 [Bacteroidetes bacterium]|jgi:hypothetical protein|nr:hypothetical protein [Bacteroidota bacterium]
MHTDSMTASTAHPLRTPAFSWAHAARILTVLLLPAVLLLTACDDDNGDITGPGNGDDDPPFSVATYDTTGNVITVSDDEEDLGIGYTDEQGTAVTEVTWTNDFIYKLDNFVFVLEGQTLNIEPGTIIKGLPGSGENAAALIVARGAQIFADGNPGSDNPDDADPIIFTADDDPVEPGMDPSEDVGLGRDVRGLWGGVILLGDAELNSTPGETNIEGVPGDARTLYGGTNNDHDIGVFRFVSIRHTGTQLGNGDEIQGLTVGGVGNGSTVEFVESYASDDDGFEWFGGTINHRNMIAAWASDDSFDMDEGYRGSNQFWLAVQAGDEAGRIAEQDGGTDPEAGTPYADVRVANATYIGIGPELADANVAGDGNDPFIIHRDNNATSYFASVFMDGRLNAGLQIEDLGSGEDSRERWLAGQLRYESNLWWNIGPDFDAATTTFEDLIQLTGDGDGGEAFRTALADYLRDEGNLIGTELPITSMNRDSEGLIVSFNPLAAGEATTPPTEPSAFDTGGVNGTYQPVDYHGAFGTDNWARGWTLLSRTGVLE